MPLPSPLDDLIDNLLDSENSMAYGPSEHAVWVDRVRNLMRELHNLAFEEGVKVDLIYTNEGGNVSDEDYVDVSYATTSEMADAITTIRELQQFLDGSAQPSQADRRFRFAPFLQ